MIAFWSVTPWNPATTATRPASSAPRTTAASSPRILAFVWTASVSIRTCPPVKLTAGWPLASRAIAISAIVTCSPVESSMSSSRLGGSALIWAASRSSSSVVLPIALTTTATWCPARRAARTLSAARRMWAGSATLVPPNFCTITLTGPPQ